MLGSLGSKTSHVDEVVRETKIEVISLVNLRDILGSELQAKSFNVGLELRNFVTADHWDHVWGLGQEISMPDACRYRKCVTYFLHRVRKGNSGKGDTVTLRNTI